MADAKRDGVPPVVVAMPLDARLEVAKANSAPFAVASGETEEGVWVGSRPQSLPIEGNESAYDTPDGTQYLSEYGEVLLLSHDRKKILRAFPLPSIPPQFISVFGDAVYCGRQGDGGLPHSMLCRIDRDTYEMSVRIFNASGDSAYPDDAYRPHSWTVDARELELHELRVDPQGVWAKDYREGWQRLDLETLEPISRSREGPRS